MTGKKNIYNEKILPSPPPPTFPLPQSGTAVTPPRGKRVPSLSHLRHEDMELHPP